MERIDATTNPYRSPTVNSEDTHEVVGKEQLNRDQCPNCATHVPLEKVGRSMFGFRCPRCSRRLRLVLPLYPHRMIYLAFILVAVLFGFAFHRHYLTLPLIAIFNGIACISMALLTSRYGLLVAK